MAQIQVYHYVPGVSSTDRTNCILLESLQIQMSMTDKSSTATFDVVKAPGKPLWNPAPLDQILILNKGTGVKIFGGTIRSLSPTYKNKNTTFITVEMKDFSTFLDEAFIVSKLYTNTTDHAIVMDLCLSFATAIFPVPDGVQTPIPEWEVIQKTPRQVLEELSEYTGAEWYVNADKNLHYSQPGHDFNGFGFSDTPNYTTTFPIDAQTAYTKDAIQIINRCTLLGAVVGSDRLSVVYNDPFSQSIYGLQPTTLIDEQATNAQVAILRAKAVVEENKAPKESITLTTRRDGLILGAMLSIKHTAYGINGNYIIREMAISQETKSVTKYDLTLGPPEADVMRLLKMVDSRSRRYTGAPTSIPGPGSVTNDSIGEPLTGDSIMVGNITSDQITSIDGTVIIANTIRANKINSVNGAVITSGSIQADSIGSVNGAVINAGSIKATNIGEVAANTITIGKVQGSQIAAIDAGTITIGVLYNERLGNSIVDDLAKYATALRPIPTITNGSELPVLPSDNYPPGSYFFWEPSGEFHQITPNGLSWTNVGATNPTGTMKFYHIGKISANSIVGVISAANIGQINAGSITGEIMANQIGEVKASVITVGKIQSTQINSITASQISTTIAGSQIGSITAGQISTAITHTQIGSVNGAVINVGSVGDLQIGGMSGGKITAQTIDSSKLNADNITVGGLASQPQNPAKINVLDSARQLCAQVGYLTTTQNGGWFKFFGAGGTNYNTAKIKTSETSAGVYSLDLLDANLSITNTNAAPSIGNTSVYTSPATFEATYSSISLNVSGSNQNNGSSKTMLVTRGLVFQNNLQTRGSFNRHVANEDTMEMVIYNGSTITCHTNGATGVIGCTGYFEIRGGGQGKPGQFVYSKPGGGQGVLNFIGGIMTSGSLYDAEGRLEWETPKDRPRTVLDMSHLEYLEYEKQQKEQQKQEQQDVERKPERKRKGFFKRILGRSANGTGGSGDKGRPDGTRARSRNTGLPARTRTASAGDGQKDESRPRRGTGTGSKKGRSAR